MPLKTKKSGYTARKKRVRKWSRRCGLPLRPPYVLALCRVRRARQARRREERQRMQQHLIEEAVARKSPVYVQAYRNGHSEGFKGKPSHLNGYTRFEERLGYREGYIEGKRKLQRHPLYRAICS